MNYIQGNKQDSEPRGNEGIDEKEWFDYFKAKLWADDILDEKCSESIKKGEYDFPAILNLSMKKY